MPSRSHWLIACVAAVPGLVYAQATVKPDGQYRYALGAGASYSSGNTDSASVNIAGDGVRATDTSKWQFGGKALWSRNDGETTAENVALGTQYDQDINRRYFGFGKLDFLRDTIANVASRESAYVGAGRHLIREENTTWDISAGVGYTQDHYVDAAVIQDESRTSYGRAELLLSEESSHKFTPTTSFRQKLSLYPSLSQGGGYRGVFDSGLAVSMTSTLSLTAGVTYRYDSDPGVGLKHSDALFVTGISVKID